MHSGIHLRDSSSKYLWKRIILVIVGIAGWGWLGMKNLADVPSPPAPEPGDCGGGDASPH